MKNFITSTAHLLCLCVTAQLSSITAAGLNESPLVWTKVNMASPPVIGLYHIESANTAPFDVVKAAYGLPTITDLIVQEPATGTGAVASTDTPSDIFGPYSLRLNGTQRIQTLDGQSNSAVSGSHTAEIWFKWDSSMTSSSFTFGFGGGATALISRDANNPANDQFGVRSGHGDYLPAPGFTSWADWSTTVPAGQWHHAAYAINSPGSIPGEGDHNLYLPGSVMRLWINNVLVATVDISNEENHQAARPHIRTFGGDGPLVDEFVLWNHDVSNGGQLFAPFADGRGTFSSARDWQLFN